MKFFYVYVMKSIRHDFLYIGFTENLRKRFLEHNSGENKSTKYYVPFELIHYEAYRNMNDAKRREMYLKENRGKTTLKTMLKDFFSESLSNHFAPLKPTDSIVCPVCNGRKEAPTKSFFGRNGDRKSGYLAICLTCKGRGWVKQEGFKPREDL